MGLQQRIGGRVLITGGTGFIGSALARRLLSEDVGVDILTRNREKVRDQFGGQVRAVQALGEIDHDGQLEPPRVIVNLAGKNLGAQRWNERVKRELVESRVATTRHVVEYIRDASQRPELLISGSAVGYYGARGSEVLDESSPPGDEFQSHLCEEWEETALAAANYGVRVCLSRTGIVLGPGGGILGQLAPLFRKGLGAIVGSGRQWVSWIALDDLIALFIDFMTDRSVSGAFNNTAPEPVPHREFAKTLGDVVNRPVLLRVPGPVLRVAMGGMARLQLTGQRAVPQRHIERGFAFRYDELRPAMVAALRSEPERAHRSNDRSSAIWHRGQ